MAVGSADIMEAIVDLWTSANLDDGYTQYWPEEDRDELSPFTVLPVQLISVRSPSSSCRVKLSKTVDRMSSSAGFIQETRDVPVEFKVYVRSFNVLEGAEGEADTFVPIDFTGVSPSEIAEQRIEDIIKVFGGHTSVGPQTVELDHGAVVVIQYLNDFISYVSDVKSFVGVIWELNYNFRVNVPVAV